MGNLQHGLLYLRFVERFVGDRASRQELRASLAPVEVASATFLAYVMKCLGYVPQFGQDGRKEYFLPLGLNGVVKNTTGTKVLWDAIHTCPTVELGKNYILKGKDVWVV